MNLHLDLSNGISGDMLLGALLDAKIMDNKEFLAELDKLPVRGEFEVIVRDDYRRGTRCKTVTVLDRNLFATSGESGCKKCRTFKEILTIVLSSGIADTAKIIAVKLFEALARAQSGAEGEDAPFSVQFEEAGSIESIVYLVGCAVVLDKLKPVRVTASPVNTGTGVAVGPAGVREIPSPQVSRLLDGFPTTRDSRECELTTLGGAALVRCIVTEPGEAPSRIVAAGWGGGERDFADYANVLKAALFEDGSVLAEEDEQPLQDAPEPAPAQNAKIEQIMSAMEDLENVFKSRASKPRPEEPEPSLARSQSVLLEKLREIESRLHAGESRRLAEERGNESLEKLKKLERDTPGGGGGESSPCAQPAEPVNFRDIAPPAPSPEYLPEESEAGVLELTASVDNSTGEELGFLAELIVANGAHEVYFEPIYTKKFRPAYKLTAVVDEKDLGLFSRLILRHSGTVAVRYTKLNRVTLKTESLIKDSPFGQAGFTRVEDRGDRMKYDDKRRIALERDLTLREIDRILDSVEDNNEK